MTNSPTDRTENSTKMATSLIEDISGLLHVYEVKRRSVSLTRAKSTWAERYVTLESSEGKNGSCQAILHYTRPSKSAFRVRELEKQVVLPCNADAALHRLDRRTCAQRSAPSAFCLELTLPSQASAPTVARTGFSKAAAPREAKVVIFSFVDVSTLDQWERAMRAAGCSSDSWPATESFREPMQGSFSALASGDLNAGWESEPFGNGPANTPPHLYTDSSSRSSPRVSSSFSSSSVAAGALVPQVPFMPVEVVPTRYLVDAKGDKEEAQRRWAATHAFRKELTMDEALTEVRRLSSFG